MPRRSSADPISHNIMNAGFNLPKREAAGLGVPPEVRTKLEEIYKGCGNGHCPCGLKFDPKEGLVPRGVAGAKGGCDKVELVVVAINPGNPKDDGSDRSEKKRYAEAWSAPPDRKIDRLIDETTCWIHSSYAGEKGEGEGQYHRRLNKYLRCCLGVNDETEDILDRVYFTELVKCSTDGKGVFSPELRCATRTCASTWLARELRLFPKKPVVALGMDTYKALCLWDGGKVFYLPHPSRPPHDQSELKKTINEVRQALGR